MKKLLCFLTAILSIFLMSVPIEAKEHQWDISKSKTATPLDEKYQTKVTLSLPSKSEKLESDVVFVLDKSTSAQVEDQALEMLEKLRMQIDKTDAKVKVGIVIFNKIANVSSWFDLSSQFDQIEVAIRKNITSGTNCHAGLLAGKEMLDQDQEVEAKRKYMIFVSDGITYMYNQEPTVTAWSFENDGSILSWAGPDNFSSKYGQTLPDWNTYLNDVKTKLESQGNTYDYPYGTTPTKTTPVDQSKEYLNSVDKALYYTYSTYESMKDEGYHCYALKGNSEGNYPWAFSFMDYLENQKEVSFESIQNDIYYLLDQGSYVEDYMGSGKDNYGNEYEFDFINDINSFYMMVGNKKYLPEVINDQSYHYGFDKQEKGYAYELYYYPGKQEYFIWKMNVPVTQFDLVQLIYTLQLANPQKEAGNYGFYDEDGHLNKNNLKTNNQATLHPIDSQGKEQGVEDFLNPTVSYTVYKTVEPEKTQETPKPQEIPKVQENTIKTKQTTKKAVKTGDEQVIYPYFVIALMSLSIMYLMKRRLHV